MSSARSSYARDNRAGGATNDSAARAGWVYRPDTPKRIGRQRLASFVATGCALWLLSGCAELASPETATEPAPSSHNSAEVDDALSSLDQLRPLDDDSVPEYDRDDFGDGWADPDGNGCDARRDVLKAQQDNAATFETISRNGCEHYPVAGTWNDPYTGQVLVADDLTEAAQAQELPVDHVVSLSAAHRSGAWQWSDEERERFANDPSNLLVTNRATNSTKGDAGADEWLPANQGFHCEFATIVISVRVEYELAISDSERASLGDLLEKCPQ